ncbi:MAG: hypothetical protein QMB98_07490 [Flaviflexus sp.]|uniref:hypothetical protein n=1 Tax=Flaviflexus sp. TaxID=1969482 RepID=UPI00352E0616
MTEDLIPPFEASAFYMVGAIALFAVLALWIAWRVRDRKKSRPQPNVNKWRKKIDGLRHQHSGDARVFALSLAKLLRDFGTELSGTDMTSLSVQEIRRSTGYREFSDLLTVLEQPSFGPDSTDVIDPLAERAKEVVGAW